MCDPVAGEGLEWVALRMSHVRSTFASADNHSAKICCSPSPSTVRTDLPSLTGCYAKCADIRARLAQSSADRSIRQVGWPPYAVSTHVGLHFQQPQGPHIAAIVDAADSPRTGNRDDQGQTHQS